jgi:hypothetical protein
MGDFPNIKLMFIPSDACDDEALEYAVFVGKPRVRMGSMNL